MKHKYFEWIVQCCELLGKEKSYGAVLVSDQNWFGCYDDGMTPESAVSEFKSNYPNGYSKELEEKYMAKQGIA